MVRGVPEGGGGLKACIFMRSIVLFAPLIAGLPAENKTWEWTPYILAKSWGSSQQLMGANDAGAQGRWSPAAGGAGLLPFSRQGQLVAPQAASPDSLSSGHPKGWTDQGSVGSVENESAAERAAPQQGLSSGGAQRQDAAPPPLAKDPNEAPVNDSGEQVTATGGGIPEDQTGTDQAMPVPATTPSPKIPTPRPDPKGLPANPTYEMFCAAADAYSVTQPGGHPPTPDHVVYEWYQDIIARNMSLSEQAMFLANVVWETGGLQYVEEIACKNETCAYGKYYGRGYIQLTWDYNYREASLHLFGDGRLLVHPELVAEVEYGWRTALFYWREHVTPRLLENDALEKHLFGYSVMAINGPVECTPESTGLDRLKIYNKILTEWGIPHELPGTMTGCHVPKASNQQQVSDDTTGQPPQDVPTAEQQSRDASEVEQPALEAPPETKPLAPKASQMEQSAQGSPPVPARETASPDQFQGESLEAPPKGDASPGKSAGEEN